MPTKDKLLDTSNNINLVEFLGYYGGDEEHALAAWVSTKRKLTEMRLKRIPTFLKELADAGHHTPFEHSCLHFLTTTDIATHIHQIKHRIATSVNTESARYKELREDKFYIPTDWPTEEKERFQHFQEECFRQYHECIERLTNNYKFSRSRAKESARYYLTYANQLKQDVMFNFRSFVHFQQLRNSEHAQLEVRNVASKMLELVRQTGKFKYSLKAFNL